MAGIQDLQKRLAAEEASSGEALIKRVTPKLKRAHSEFSPTTAAEQSLWDEAHNEILKETKKALIAKKSIVPLNILKDLGVLQKSIAVSTESRILADGVLSMVNIAAIVINERAEKLKKGESLVSSITKKVGSNISATVSSTARALLAPLPFGMGDAIVSKIGGMFGGGSKERQSEKLTAFASRVFEDKEDLGEDVKTPSSKPGPSSKPDLFAGPGLSSELSPSGATAITYPIVQSLSRIEGLLRFDLFGE